MSSPRRWLARLAAMMAVALAATLAVAIPAHAAIGLRPVKFIWTTLGPFQEGSASVSCASGERIVSGGYLSMSLSPQVKFTSSYPSNDTTWLVTAINRTNVAQEIHITGVCATGIAGYERKIGSPSAVPAFGFGNTTMSCPGSKVALGGGFVMARDPNLIVTATRLSAPNTWHTRIFNGTSATVNHQAVVTCTSLTGQVTDLSGVSALAGQRGWATNNCDFGIATGGGYRFIGGETSTQIVTANIPLVPSGWKLNYNNQAGGSTWFLELSLVCFQN
jgi:hypothetical protein